MSLDIPIGVHPDKPLLRGWLHAAMFPAAVIGGVILLTVAGSPTSRTACAIFILTACLLFGISAVYHIGRWKPRTKEVLRRLDHANIFLIIAGTYTPLALLLLRQQSGTTLMWVTWSAAIAGITLQVLWPSAPRWLSAPSYLAIGWAAVFFVPDFTATGRIPVLVLILLGGLAYSAGAIVYARRRPDPWPRWFGFHELFHTLTLAGFTAHYAAVLLIVVQP